MVVLYAILFPRVTFILYIIVKSTGCCQYLKMPEFGKSLHKLEVAPRLSLQLVELLNSRSEKELLNIHCKGGRPTLRGHHFDNTCHKRHVCYSNTVLLKHSVTVTQCYCNTVLQ